MNRVPLPSRTACSNSIQRRGSCVDLFRSGRLLQHLSLSDRLRKDPIQAFARRGHGVWSAQGHHLAAVERDRGPPHQRPHLGSVVWVALPEALDKVTIAAPRGAPGTTSGLGQATTVAHGATRSTERRRRGGPRHGPRVTRGVWGVVCALRKRPDDSRPGTGRDGIVTCERRWHRTATYEISTKTM